MTIYEVTKFYLNGPIETKIFPTLLEASLYIQTNQRRLENHMNNKTDIFYNANNGIYRIIKKTLH